MTSVFWVWFWLGATGPGPAAAAQIASSFPGWEIDVFREGDLNADGLEDVVVTLKRPEGRKKESRKTWLVVFFKSADGALRLHTRAAKAVCLDCGGMKAPPGEVVGVPSIDGKGILTLEYEGGSREIWNYRLKWRYEKVGDRFALIGDTLRNEDTVNEPGDADPGMLIYQDINYLSGKMIRKVAGQGTRTCDVKPGMASDDLAKFDFERYAEADQKFVRGSCKK